MNLLTGALELDLGPVLEAFRRDGYARLGVIAPEAHALFSKFSPAGVIAYRGLAMAKGDYRASFELTMARKDARLMIEAAGPEPLAVLPAVAARMDALIARGHGQDDVGVLSVDSVPSNTLEDTRKAP